MPYATPADMVASFGNAEMTALSDIGEPRLDAVDVDVLQRVLSDASALIDGYLAGRYRLPLHPVPAALRVHCSGVARYLLMTNAPDERAKADFKAAVSFLERVASGAIALLPPAETGQVAEGMGPVVFNTGSKVFGREAC